jgi:ketosteroid isomerase-like protein
MSEENVDNLRQGFDAFNRGDRTAWLARCDPGLEWVPPADSPESTAIRGREAVWEFLARIHEAWDEGAYDLTSRSSMAGTTRSRRLAGRHVHGKTSGIEFAFDFWWVVMFRDGKALRSEGFANRADALEAAGLSE